MLSRIGDNLAFQNGSRALAQKSTTDETLNIGYLIPQFPGQTHIFFWREIKALESLGARVSLFSTRLPPRGLISHDWSNAAIDRTTYLGRIRPVSALRAWLSLPWRELRHDLRTDGWQLLKDVLICAAPARNLATICRQQGIQHVHVHSCGRAALTAALANRMAGLSYSVTLHGPMSDYGVGQGYKWRRAAFATIITRKLLAEAKDQLGEDLPNQIDIQPMGVETEELRRTQPYRAPDPKGRINLFSCGRLNRVKGHQDLLQAARQLVDQGYDVHLNIAGEDDDGGNGYRPVLQDLIAELDLTGRAHLLGAISAEDVKQHLFAADFFVLASWSEPLGVAYMEAMSCAVPTIGTDAGGVPELITHGRDGVLVAPKDPTALAQALADLIENPALSQKLSKAGREKIKAGFHSGIGAETIFRQISELVKTGD